MGLAAGELVTSRRPDDYVLVIDDDPDIRETLIAVLDAYDYRAEGVGDGAEALAWLRAHPHQPCLVLLDLMMPNVNGIEFRTAQLADPTLADLPVVVMTGAPTVSRNTVLAGLDVLVKPISVATVVAHVTPLCRRRGERQVTRDTTSAGERGVARR
jgi:DNA-binding response OmpR family regulator